MRLYSFQIQNFKSIIDTDECKIPPDDNLLIIAGQNESGKSSILQALDFFANGPSPDFERLQKRKEEFPCVKCSFNLDDTELADLQNQPFPDEIKIYLEGNTTSFKRGSLATGDNSNIYLDEQFSEDINNVVISQEGTVYDMTGLTEFLVTRIKQFVFYDSFNNLLPGEIIVSDIAGNIPVLDFEKVFKINFGELVNKDSKAIEREKIRLNREASDDLNTYWTQKLEEGDKYNFIVNVTPKDPREQSLIQFMIDRENGDPLWVEQKSQGFRWFSAFNLRLKSHASSDDELKKIVLLIDEPGQGLHEKAQLDVKKVLEELAEKGVQTIYSTHCPALIGTNGIEFSRIRIISNEKTGTKISNISQQIGRKGYLDALSPIRTAMGINSINSTFDRSKFNVIVEGITDHFYFEAFKKIFELNGRYEFIPACGVSNVQNVASILIGWGVNFRAVFDNDPGQGQKAYRSMKKYFFKNNLDELGRIIYQLDGCLGIEDLFSKNDFKNYVLGRDFTSEESGLTNSEIAKRLDKKDFLARMFLDKVSGEARPELDDETKVNIQKIVDWLTNQFNS